MYLLLLLFQPEEEPLKGKFKLLSKPPEYSNFAISASGVIVVSVFACVSATWVFMQLIIHWFQDLGVHTEDLGYLKMGIFSPFWMINKTGLTLEYKVQLLFINVYIFLTASYNSIFDDHFDFRRAPQLPDTLQPRIFRCCQLAIPNARQAGWVKVMMSTAAYSYLHLD